MKFTLALPALLLSLRSALHAAPDWENEAVFPTNREHTFSFRILPE